MKFSLLLVFLLSCIMLDTTYSQNLIDRVKNEQHIAYSYFMGEKKNEENAYKKAILHYEKSVKDMQRLSDDEIIVNHLDGAYLNLGVLYFTQGNHEKSLDYKCKYYNIFPDRLTRNAENDIIIQNLYVNNAERGWKPIENGIPNIAYTSDDGEMYFYNAQKLKKKNGIVKVWIKRDQTGIKPPSENEDYESYKLANEKATKGLNEILQLKFPFIITLDEYDCRMQKYRVLKIIPYDKDGKEIYTSNYNNAEWQDPIPGTLAEQLLEFFSK